MKHGDKQSRSRKREDGWGGHRHRQRIRKLERDFLQEGRCLAAKKEEERGGGSKHFLPFTASVNPIPNLLLLLCFFLCNTFFCYGFLCCFVDLFCSTLSKEWPWSQVRSSRHSGSNSNEMMMTIIIIIIIITTSSKLLAWSWENKRESMLGFPWDDQNLLLLPQTQVLEFVLKHAQNFHSEWRSLLKNSQEELPCTFCVHWQ